MMKRVLYIMTALMIWATTVTAQDQKADSLLNVIESATEQLRFELSQQPVATDPITNLQAGFISPNIMEVTWTPAGSGKMDLEYYAPGIHTEWQHSFAAYLDSVDISAGRAAIGVGMQSDWFVRASRPGWESTVIEVEPWNEPDPDPEPELTEKKIVVSEGVRSEINTPVPHGLIEMDDNYRMYFFDRTSGNMLYAESDDLESWTASKESRLQMGKGYFVIQDGGSYYIYNDEGRDMYLSDFDPEKEKISNKRLAYSWRIDGTVGMNVQDGTWYSLGRVRGSGPVDAGGWADEWPPYPELSELPFVDREFAKHLPSWADGEKLIKDRRGISLHMSTNGRNWTDGQVIADPVDYSEKPFRGWTQRGENGIGDFYASMMIDDERLLVKAYMKEKDRIIDRWDYSPDMDIRRRFRFTGETIIIPARLVDGRVEFVSTDSVIPREFHERRTPDAVQYPTCSDCVELGQMNTSNTAIYKDGYVYLPYGYRDDIHYEAPGFDYYSGVYIYRVPVEEFDEIWKD